MSKRPNNNGIARRTLIKAVAALPLTTALAGYSHELETAEFTHGVASGDPMNDRVILWTRAVPADKTISQISVGWEVARDANFQSVVATGLATTDALRDFTVKIDVDGLEAATVYFYRFHSNAAVSPTGQTKTLPVGATEIARLAVVCCANLPVGYFNAYQSLAERSDIDVVLHLGDYIYEYPRDHYGEESIEEVGRIVAPKEEAVSLADYRERYACYRLDPDLQAVHARHPFIAVWDDHDSANNSWKDGAKNHNAGEGDWVDRKAAFQQAWLEWLPVRETASTAKGEIYRAFEFGDLARLIMLDTRLIGRDQQLNYGRDLQLDLDANAEGNEQLAETFREDKLLSAHRSMLGSEQEAWLTEQMATSKQQGQTWQLLGQQVVMGNVQVPTFDPDWLDPGMKPWPKQDGKNMMSELVRLKLPTNLDAWSGYPVARSRLLRSVADNSNNAIVLSGDSHNAWACALPCDEEIVAVEFAVQSVTSHGLEIHLPFNPDKIAKSYVKANSELLWADTHHRGYMTVTLTHEKAYAEWWILDTVRKRQFTATQAHGLMVNATAAKGVGSIEAG